jgi:hypothetical protein
MFVCDELAQEQKFPTSISGEMNAKHAYNSARVHKPLLNIEELWLRSPPPAATPE